MILALAEKKGPVLFYLDDKLDFCMRMELTTIEKGNIITACISDQNTVDLVSNNPLETEMFTLTNITLLNEKELFLRDNASDL